MQESGQLVAPRPFAALPPQNQRRWGLATGVDRIDRWALGPDTVPETKLRTARTTDVTACPGADCRCTAASGARWRPGDRRFQNLGGPARGADDSAAAQCATEFEEGPAAVPCGTRRRNSAYQGRGAQSVVHFEWCKRLAESAVSRFKALVSVKLAARTFESQRVEAHL